MNYLIRTQIPYSQESVSKSPIFNNNNIANSGSGILNMIPPVNSAPNCYQEDTNMISSTGYYYHSYPEGIGDRSKGRQMSVDDYKPRNTNFFGQKLTR